MSIELRPLGVNCNIACQYCYQNPIKDAGNFSKSYDMAAMKRAIDKTPKAFALFGGEPLLVPLPDMETIFGWGYDRHGRNTIQTNGVLISDDHIDLFKQYNVQVGVSFDGPGSLNDVRWTGNLEKTRQAAQKTEEAITKLCAAGITTSVIITLHKANASADKLPLLHAYLHKLADEGVQRVRLHVLEIDHPLIRAKYALSTAENIAALLSFAQLEEELPHNFLDVFEEIKELIYGRDYKTSCVWRACDPYTTAAVQGIEGNGQQTNCGRTNKDGIDFAKANQPGFERYIALYHTPQAVGGCQGCRFFLMCKGQCPGTAIDGDWRNRTEYCDLWFELFTYFEQQLLENDEMSISQHPQRLEIEDEMMRFWQKGRNVPIAEAHRAFLVKQGQVEQTHAAA